jgi:1-acyl-sn-glycerol-3-phosphate acyltransferase
VLAVVWVPAVALLLRLRAGYTIEDVDRVRREYRRLRAAHLGPLLICANHLTLIDSAIVAWALGSAGWYLANYSSLPWNVPERRNFAATLWQRAGAYLMKCLPITRGGSRTDVARVLAEFAHVLSRGDVGLVFPEGGRSRTGRIEVEDAAPGVGRVVRSLGGCPVLCVYVRGRHQGGFSDYPVRAEHFDAALSLIRPTSKHDGLRGSRDIARQILAELAAMEQRYFDAR